MAAACRLFACVGLVAAAVVNAAHTHSLRLQTMSHGFVQALEFKHRLRVCNAYPYAAPLDVYRGKNERLTGDAPMPYKTCRDFMPQLQSGDKLEFKVGDSSAGTFSVSDLPNNDAVLLLVIHRHDALSTAVAFESHVFANLANAQVAVIDTYKGATQTKPKISEMTQKEKTYSEELRYDSVVALSPGIYEVMLEGKSGASAKSELVAASHESYVILRTGVEAKQGQAFPEELVVFPNSDEKLVRSSAFGMAPALFSAMLAMSATAWC